MATTNRGPREFMPKAADSLGQIEGVVFDYGRTLVTFAYPRDDLLRVLDEFRPRIEAALGVPAPEADTILHDVLLPLEEYINSMGEDEVDYMEVYRETWERAGMRLPDDLLHDILDAEQQCWDRAVTVDPDVPRILQWLGEHGMKRGVCSNAPFPPAMMRRQVESNGIAAMLDGMVFSSEVGRRKPAPEVYQAALDAIGTEAARTLFAGDRVREDYEGPMAIGMQAVVVTRHADEQHLDGVRTIASLADLPSLL